MKNQCQEKSKNPKIWLNLTLDPGKINVWVLIQPISITFSVIGLVPKRYIHSLIKMTIICGGNKIN